MSTLAVIRHGQASFDAEDYDVLSPLGIAQSRALGASDARRGRAPDRLYTGRLRRQVDTARHYAAALRETGARVGDAIELDELDEFPGFEIMKHAVPRLVAEDAEVQALIAGLGGPSDDPRMRLALQPVFELVMGRWVHGRLDVGELESFDAFEARVRRGLGRVMADAGRKARVAVMTSGGPVAVSMRMALGLSPQKTIEVAAMVRNSAVTEYQFRPDRFTLAAFNDVAHLEPAQVTLR